MTIFIVYIALKKMKNTKSTMDEIFDKDFDLSFELESSNDVSTGEGESVPQTLPTPSAQDVFKTPQMVDRPTSHKRKSISPDPVRSDPGESGTGKRRKFPGPGNALFAFSLSLLDMFMLSNTAL